MYSANIEIVNADTLYLSLYQIDNESVYALRQSFKELIQAYPFSENFIITHKDKHLSTISLKHNFLYYSLDLAVYHAIMLIARENDFKKYALSRFRVEAETLLNAIVQQNPELSIGI